MTPTVMYVSQDFHQKETVGGTSLHKALVQKWVVVPKGLGQKGSRKKKKSPLAELTAESKGIATFEKFKRFTLSTTHRFKDTVHADNMQAMRSTLFAMQRRFRAIIKRQAMLHGKWRIVLVKEMRLLCAAVKSV